MGAPPLPPKRPASRAATLSGLLTTSSVPTLMADAAALHIPGLGGAPGWARLLAQSREQQHEHQEEQQQQQQAQQQSQQKQRQQLQAETSVPVEAELLAQLTEGVRRACGRTLMVPNTLPRLFLPTQTFEGDKGTSAPQCNDDATRTCHHRVCRAINVV